MASYDYYDYTSSKVKPKVLITDTDLDRVDFKGEVKAVIDPDDSETFYLCAGAIVTTTDSATTFNIAAIGTMKTTTTTTTVTINC